MSEIPYMLENTPEEFERVRGLAWPAPALTAEEAARVAVFDAAEEPEEVTVIRAAIAAPQTGEEHRPTEIGNMMGGYDCACGEPWLTDRCMGQSR